MNTREILPPDEETAALPTVQLLANLSHESPYLRGRVMVALGKRLQESPNIFDALFQAIKASENRETSFFGFIMVAWLGVITVLENGTQEQIQRVNELVDTWTTTEQEDLQHHLKDSGLPLNLY